MSTFFIDLIMLLILLGSYKEMFNTFLSNIFLRWPSEKIWRRVGKEYNLLPRKNISITSAGRYLSDKDFVLNSLAQVRVFFKDTTIFVTEEIPKFPTM